MKKFIKISALALAGLLSLACVKTPEFITTEKGPEMTITASESAFMGDSIRFSVTVNDKDFALSTVKANLLFGETVVSNLTIRTKENGTYTASMPVPLLAKIPDGNATLAFAAQNVGLGLTYDTLEVAVKRPNFDQLTLIEESGATRTISKKADYKYELTADLPSLYKVRIATPAVTEDGKKIELGWASSKLEVGNENYIPYSAQIAGEYTIYFDLFTLEAGPFKYVISKDLDLSESKKSACYDLTQNLGLKAPAIADWKDWDFDPDFFVKDSDGNVMFNAVDGRYRFTADFVNAYIRVEPVDADDKNLTLQDDGTGAVWMIGSQFGKPTIGPGWNTTDGAYAFAQVSPKVYQMSLNAGGQLGNGFSLKLFHQKGWGGEYLQSNYASFDGIGVFKMTESGNIELADGGSLADGKAYRFTLDLTGGKEGAILKVKEVAATEGASLDIRVNGEKAAKISKTVYRVKKVALKKGDAISFSGIDKPEEWYVDPDHFVIEGGALKFNAVEGYYSIEMNLTDKYVTVRRVDSTGGPAKFADDGALYLMGWGVGNPVMSKQLAWDSGQLITLAEVEDGLYYFTGVAVEADDETTVGGRIAMTPHASANKDMTVCVSMKLFGQAGWGTEQGDVVIGDSAKALGWSLPGNIELIAANSKLEKGKTYRFIFDLRGSSLVDSKFAVKFDCVEVK
jgi:hypothetical protein